MPSDGTQEKSIPEEMPDAVDKMTGLVVRPTGHEAGVHIKDVWESEYGELKVGVKSKREYAEIFSEKLDWDRSHHRWNSERVEDTDMWEIDLDALFYVICAFVDENADVTVDDEVWRAFVNELG